MKTTRQQQLTCKQVDRFAALSEQLTPLLAEMNELKRQFRARGVGLYAGSNVALMVDTHETQTLDQKVVKSLLTPGQIVQATRMGSRTNIKLIDVVNIAVETIKKTDVTTDEPEVVL